MKIARETRQAAAVVTGGVALFYAAFVTTLTLARGSPGLAVLVAALIAWREFEFTGMRVELHELRKR